MERILCAAIWYKNGKHYKDQPINIESGFVFCGRRHHNCINLLFQILPHYDKLLIGRDGQGFITSLDRFVGRKEAWQIAIKAGQVIDRTTNELLAQNFPGDDKILTSEDLY